MWPVYLINLAEQRERMEKNDTQFSEFNIAYERMEAENGWQLTHMAMIRASITTPSWTPPAPPTPTISSTCSAKGSTPSSASGGVRLSGGQRQRLAVARAFFKNAPVLILDEATSSLDTSSERHIQTALEHLRVGRTALVIAHRLPSFENAGRIALMEDGRIVDIGVHADLLERSPIYAALYRFQFARRQPNLDPPERMARSSL